MNDEIAELEVRIQTLQHELRDLIRLRQLRQQEADLTAQRDAAERRLLEPITPVVPVPVPYVYNGYVCFGCGMWVSAGSLHVCRPRTYPITPYSPWPVTIYGTASGTSATSYQLTAGGQN